MYVKISLLYYLLIATDVDAIQSNPKIETVQLPLDEFLNGIKDVSSFVPEWNMTTAEIIRYHGYPVEEHDVTTSDGYILSIQRIPHGKKTYHGKRQNPIIVQHGMLATSSSWVLNIAQRNLPYKLADAGYDVWLTNVRGTSYGQRHLKLSLNDTKFWNFSFDEMGIYDMPAIIDYVIVTSKSKQVYYIGHSMGAAILSITLSTLPQYNNKIALAFYLAPVHSVRYTTTLARGYRFLTPYLWKLEGTSLRMNSQFSRNTVNEICQTPIRSICRRFVAILIGINHDQHNMTRMPVYTGHFPDSISFQTLNHYVQTLSMPFRMYDFGHRNRKIYGKLTPPEYELSKITTPIIIFWSDQDIFSHSLAVADLLPNLPSVIQVYRVPNERFSHVDYAIADNADRLVYDKILEMLEIPLSHLKIQIYEM